MTPAELRAGIVAVQTVERTTVLGVDGWRVTCSCGRRYGTDRQARAVAWAKRHGQQAHGGA